MNLKTVTNQSLLFDLKNLVAREREVLTQILNYLHEVETRRLHLILGHPSLFEFATQELGYSNSAAQRRILAMRLLKNIPEMEEKIANGELSLSVAAQVQGFFRHEERVLRTLPRSPEEKREIVTSLLGTSSRDCERRLAELSPEIPLPQEREKALPGKHTLIQFTADEELFGKLERLKGLLAHRNFDGSYAKLFDQLADIALKKLSKDEEDASHSQKAIAAAKTDSPKLRRPESALKSRYISSAVKRAVWRRDGGKCTFVGRNPANPGTIRRCASRHALQYDHIHPHAWGGTNTEENLTLRCASHNRFRAEKFGSMPKHRQKKAS